MNAFQYFYENGEVVGKVDAGTLEYDSRPMHDHWHFRDFAAYSLLDENHVKVLDSGKEAFCLAPTDPIDLTVDNAEWRPWLTDLSTACGEEGSVWIREVLQTGWGDTYAQYRPGQSFEITDLPNGTYFVKVQANPDGVLLEGSSDQQRRAARDSPTWQGRRETSRGAPLRVDRLRGFDLRQVLLIHHDCTKL